MLVQISCDERHPDYTLSASSGSSSYDVVVEIPEELKKRYDSAVAEYSQVMDEIHEIYESNKKPRPRHSPLPIVNYPAK